MKMFRPFRRLWRRLFNRTIVSPAIDQWIDALESGEYEQAKGVLCRVDESGEPIGYCCLGVLCELYQRQFGDLKIEVSGTLNDKVRTYDGAVGGLPEKVKAWSGLVDGCGVFDNLGETDSLASMNDSQGKKFVEIAAVIKSQPKGMFRV